MEAVFPCRVSVTLWRLYSPVEAELPGSEGEGQGSCQVRHQTDVLGLMFNDLHLVLVLRPKLTTTAGYKRANMVEEKTCVCVSTRAGTRVCVCVSVQYVWVCIVL